MTPMVFEPKRAKASNGWLWVFVALMSALALVITWITVRTVWGANNMRYELTETELVLTYGPSQYVIPRAEISKTEVINPTKGFRTFGTGLPGLQEGRYSFAETGSIRMLSRSTRPLTVIHTNSEKWGLSPADPTAFLLALNNGQTGTFLPVARNSTTSLFLLSLTPLLTIGVAILIYWLMGVGKRIRYVLRDEELVVEGLLRPIHIRYSDMTDVQVASPKGVPWRIYGTSMPGLYWGSFSWRQVAKKLRLYATAYKPILLIATEKATFGISPERDEECAAELRKRLTPGA